MRLLIVTQAVDQDDPALGFFHRWIEELAAHFERVEVICLKEGLYALPSNVRVHSLGKEGGVRSRLSYAMRFFGIAWHLRHEYDAVFVHMNEEYVLIAGILWRLLGKRVVLWRNHKMGSWRTRFAALLVHRVCYTSPVSFVASYANAIQMPIGIDTGLFVLPRATPPPDSILLFGRLDRVKKCGVFFDALELVHTAGTAFHADSYGDPTLPDDSYAHDVRQSAEPLVRAGRLAFHPSVPNRKAPGIYGAHAIYVNLTPSGSFDKTIGEAMACGSIVVCANDVVAGIMPPECLVESDSPASVAAGLSFVLTMDESARLALRARQREYIECEHSLRLLAERLTRLFA